MGSSATTALAVTATTTTTTTTKRRRNTTLNNNTTKTIQSPPPPPTQTQSPQKLGKKLVLAAGVATTNTHIKTVPEQQQPARVVKVHHQKQQQEEKRKRRTTTTLMYAALQGDVDTVRLLVHAEPFSVLERDRTGKTALHYCCSSGGNNSRRAAQVADLLVMAAPELVECREEDGFTPLHMAVIAGNMQLVTFLLGQGADVHAVDNERHTVVHWATVCGETAALRAVLAAKAPVSTPDVHGGYPLHYAAQMCGSEKGPNMGFEVLQALLTHPQIDVGVEDGDGRPPLLWAASAGSARAMLALIRAGSRVECADQEGLTALHCAASRGHTDCIDTLLTLCGAGADLIDTNGCTALHYAVTLGHADATALLLAHSASPNRQDRKGRTPAHCGCARGQLETVKMLATLGGANMWLKNARGDLPLHEAAASGRRELVQWLLEMRPSQVNARNNDGRCPLHQAALNDNADMCKILLDAGANVNPLLRTSRNQFMTPLDCALRRGFRSTAKFLQVHGGVPASRLNTPNTGTTSVGNLSKPHSELHLQIRDDVTLLGDDTSTEESELDKGMKVKRKNERKKKKNSGTAKLDQKSSGLVGLESGRGSTGKSEDDSKNRRLGTAKMNGTATKNGSYGYGNEIVINGKTEININQTRQIIVGNENVDSERLIQEAKIAEKRIISGENRRNESAFKVTEGSDQEVSLSKIQEESIHKIDSSLEKSSNNGKSICNNFQTEDRNQIDIGTQNAVKELEFKNEETEKTRSFLKKLEPDQESIASKSSEDIKAQRDLYAKVDVHVTPSKIMETIACQTDEDLMVESKEIFKKETQTEEENTNGIKNQMFEEQNPINKPEGNFKENKPVEIEENIDEATKLLGIKERGEDSKKDNIDNKAESQDKVDLQINERNEESKKVSEEKEELAELKEECQSLDSSKKEFGSSESPNKEASNFDPQIKNCETQIEETQILATSNQEKQNQEQLNEEIDNNLQEVCNVEMSNDTKNGFIIEETLEPKSDHKTEETVYKSSETKEAISQPTSSSPTSSTASSTSSSSNEHKSFRVLDESVEKTKTTRRKLRRSALRKQRSKSEENKEAIRNKSSSKGVERNGKEEDRKVKSSLDSSKVSLPNIHQRENARSEPSIPDAIVDSATEEEQEELEHDDDESTLKKRRSKRRGCEELNDEQQQSAGSDYESSNIMDSGIEPSPRRSRIPKWKNMSERSVNMTSVTQSIQTNIRKYHLERKIFQHLLELKRLQIRSGQHNESVLVKRAVDAYHRSCASTVGAGRYVPDDLTFKSFEKFLYEALRKLQRNGTNLDHLKGLPSSSEPVANHLQCTKSTHRCMHTVHAYTGVPCAAYLPKLDHHTIPKIGFDDDCKPGSGCFLPTIKSRDVMVELQHSGDKQMISLPTDKLDRNKRYYVTFTIKGGETGGTSFAGMNNNNKELGHIHAKSD